MNMEFTETFRESLNILVINKLRTSLAILGIIIGIGSVITLISLGQAAQKSIENNILSLGANMLTVIPGAQSTGGVRGADGSATTLTNEDADAIASDPSITTIDKVSPEFTKRTQVTTGRSNTNARIYGVKASFMPVHKIQLKEGSFLTEQHVKSLSRVAVIGEQVMTDLFGNTIDPIGQTIRIHGQIFTVIGTTVSRGANPDDTIYIPLGIAQKQLFGQNYLTSITLEAINGQVMDEAHNQVGFLLLSKHKLKDLREADFQIFSQTDLLKAASQTADTFTTLLAGIAAISLLVGGIGIMNIMLVTVTERTREIGLRKAIGAKKRTIGIQFLFEAVILTFLGGIMGMTLGIYVSYLISAYTGLAFIISPDSILLAIGVSASIGIIFGWYPARHAANMNPIDALRYE